jgi:hypothetical protein
MLVVVKLTNANPYRLVNDLIVAVRILKSFPAQLLIQDGHISVHCPGTTIIKSLQGSVGNSVYGQDTCINYTNAYTGQYVVAHNYQHTGLYEVCVKILYFGGCEARKCKPVQIGERPDSCRADFERILTNANPLRVYFRALPWHNNNKKPARICWQFGDGQDTCINYPKYLYWSICCCT